MFRTQHHTPQVTPIQSTCSHPSSETGGGRGHVVGRRSRDDGETIRARGTRPPDPGWTGDLSGVGMGLGRDRRCPEMGCHPPQFPPPKSPPPKAKVEGKDLPQPSTGGFHPKQLHINKVTDLPQMVKVLAKAEMGAVRGRNGGCELSRTLPQEITCCLCSPKSVRIKYMSAACCEEIQHRS